MPSFNTFVKLNSVKNTDLSGSPRDKLRQLASSANGIASIADEFLNDDPNTRSLADSTGIYKNEKYNFYKNSEKDVIYFPDDLGSQDYPAWVQFSMYKRETLSKQLDDDSTIGTTVGDAGVLGFVKSVATDTANTAKAYAKTLEEYSYDGSKMELLSLVCLPLQSGMGVNNTGVEIAAENVGAALGQIAKNGIGVAEGDLTGFFAEQLKQHILEAPPIGNAYS